jgi:FKBP-type peptidyl-prolyl cis-trans isomerase FklB
MSYLKSIATVAGLAMSGLLAAPTVAAQSSPTKADVSFEKAEVDSINRAYATVMATYLAPYLKEKFPDNANAANEFVEGMRHAFEIRNADQPYFEGVRSAMANFDRFDSMVDMGFPFTAESYTAALQAALSGDTFGMDQKQADAYLHGVMERLYPAPKPLSAESQQAFLDAQSKREGVTKLPSGLLFEVITEGEGESPKAGETARVTYKGALADGSVFDQTEKPIDLPVNGVVKGFSEGLQMMKPGGTYRLFFPASLGYGENGAGGVIPPGAALDFTVTLLDIVKK